MLAQDAPLTWAGAWAIMLPIGLLLIVSGLVVVGVAKRLADGQIGMSGIAGIRTSATMSSPEAWSAAHRAGKKLTVIGGRTLSWSAAIAIGAGLWFGEGDPERTTAVWAVVVGVSSVGVLVPILLGARAGHRAAVVVRDRNA